MLNKLVRLLLTPDGNTDGGSSSSSDGNGAESSTAEQDGNNAAEGEEQEASQSEGNTEESSEQGTGEQEAGDQENNQQEGEGEQEAADKKEKEKFIPRERFDEVNTKYVTTEAKVKQLEPLAQQATVLNDYMRDNNISTQEFQSALVYLRNLKNDPAAAFAMLKPTYEQLAQLNGEVLPADLQAEVAAGTLALERAKEIGKARAQTGYQQARTQWQQSGVQQQVGDVIGQTTQLWIQTKQSIDPDFKNGTPLFQQVDWILQSLPAANNAVERMQRCDEAYKKAKEFLGQNRKAPVAAQGKRPPSSQQRSTNGNAVLKTDADVIAAMKAGLRPNQVSYAR